MNAAISVKSWQQCPHCKEIFGQVYDKRIKLSSIVASKCARCWAVREILSCVTDTANPGTELVGSIWHDNTLEIGVITPEDSFETAKGHKIYIVADSEKHARLDSRLGIPIAYTPTHRNYRPIKDSDAERISVAKEWLADCVASHEACNAECQEYEWPRRVLDISQDEMIRLVSIEYPPPGATYVALSYCWGRRGGNLCTYESNLAQHKKGIPLKSLPQTIRDIVSVCKQLGQQYLWVDALCIIQDDPADKMTQIPMMADIYSGALLVVSAAGTADVLEGCPLGPPELQPIQPKVLELEYPRYLEANPENKGAGKVTVVVERMEHEHCRRLPGHWARETFDQDGVDLLNTIEDRAWTFQERFLAKRALYIGKGELSWVCASAVQCECRKSRLEVKTEDGDRVFNHRYCIGHVSTKRLFSDSNKDLYKTFSYLWAEVVTTYSARLLTQFTDRVAALEGLSAAFSRRWPEVYARKDYAFGCWEPFLRDLLVWQASGEEPVSENVQRGLFPSWAWPSSGRAVSFTSWVWYGVDPKSWVEVVRLERGPPADEVFGSGKGTLTIRAPLIACTAEAPVFDDGSQGDDVVCTALDAKLPFLRGYPSLDDPSQKEEWKTVTHMILLASYPFKPHGSSRPLSFALLCVAPVLGKDEFRRIGMITTVRPKRTFEAHEFEELLLPHMSDVNLV
ncbi:HET-domain-containing protein [Trichoderma citrinoviride]|uniref:HET-domain-containing protein n=1 Tax=Trichoderma citrinoviride TaxID=58853 RepID=A0A2T4AYU3_9HYPO|nr:HET-domain-containing protein [Trichoderma citrinoviride]PTB62148.1 HET-domain-containing protein [Trichoderma citrinoviride]